MAYFIFLKYLRSLEEFRKNHHVKIPPKSLCANFQSLGEFKNQIFNSKKIFLLHFWPGYPYRPTWPLAQPAPLAPLLPQAEAQPTWPLSRFAHACRWRISPKMFSSLIYAFRSRRLLSIPSLTHGPRLLAPSSPPRRLTLTMSPPHRRSPRRPLRTSGCRRAITAPHHSPLNPPSNRALTSLNGFNRHSPPPLL
jgi:hypothetical protein